MTAAPPPTDTRNRSKQQAAERIGISLRQLERHILLGNVRAVRFGRRVLIAASEVERVAAAGLPSLPRMGS